LKAGNRAKITLARQTPFELSARRKCGKRSAEEEGRLTATLETMARTTGEIGELARSTINITNNVAVLSEHPAFLKVQATLLHALAAFPDARASVVTALRDLDSGNAPAGTAAKVIEHVAA
jgi:hypothetical protein